MITAPVMQIDQSVDETFKTNISCTASGLPAPTIQWFHNEEELVNGSRNGRIALSSSESSAMDTLFTMSELLFITVERSDAGRYSCVASNGVGGNATIDPAYILFVNCEWVLLNTCRPPNQVLCSIFTCYLTTTMCVFVGVMQKKYVLWHF